MDLTHQIFNLTGESLHKYSFSHISSVKDPYKTAREKKGREGKM